MNFMLKCFKCFVFTLFLTASVDMSAITVTVLRHTGPKDHEREAKAFKIELSDTIATLKDKIKNTYNIPVITQLLFLQKVKNGAKGQREALYGKVTNTVLWDAATFSQCSVSEGTEIHLVTLVPFNNSESGKHLLILPADVHRYVTRNSDEIHRYIRSVNKAIAADKTLLTTNLSSSSTPSSSSEKKDDNKEKQKDETDDKTLKSSS